MLLLAWCAGCAIYLLLSMNMSMSRQKKQNVSDKSRSAKPKEQEQDIDNKLKQASALRPFPRKFVPLAVVAPWTGQYKVIDTIGWDVSSSHTTQWECVINMIDILSIAFLEFGKTTCRIVATIMLTL